MKPRFSVLLISALVLSGCIDDAASEFQTTIEPSTSGLVDSTTSTVEVTTSTTVELGSFTIHLLDGSELNIAGPAQLELSAYHYFIEIPGGETNVYLTRPADPAKAAAAESADFHSDLGDGVKLWVGNREGRPFFMTVEMSGWVSFVHVGWETAPDSEFVLALADRLRGEASDRGVVIPEFAVDVFETSLHEPDSENSVELWSGQCLREPVPGAEVVEHPVRGELVRSSGYASWCEPDSDLEVTVSGTGSFVDQVILSLSVVRTLTATSTPESVQPYDADSCAATFYPAVDANLIRQPREDEEFMVSFQDSDQWDGGYPVCWAVYQSDATGCEFFALHMDVAYSEAVWAESGSEDPPCEINITSDPESYQEYPTP